MPIVEIQLNVKQYRILSNMSSVYGNDAREIAKHLLVDCIATEERRIEENKKSNKSPTPSVIYTGPRRYC